MGKRGVKTIYDGMGKKRDGESKGVAGSRQFLSAAQEQRIAKKVAGRRQPASGAIEGFKGDVISEMFLLECKRTDKRSMSVKLDWVEKICSEAERAGRLPALSFEWDGLPKYLDRDWIMLPSKTLAFLLQFWMENKENDKEGD